jgi:asparagine synthase (glutamine-hydrolysing)
LIAAYDFYGMYVFDQLDGMFAFAIFDKSKGQVVIARDHLGIKPLYYYKNGSQFYFSSEIKALFTFDSVPKVISVDGITEFLFNGWLYEPDTGYEDILKVMPGESIIYDLKNNIIKSDIYFDVARKGINNAVSKNKTIDELINKSLKIQCRSDVPLGVFFSGGVDSSVIVSKINNTICLTAKYEKEDTDASGMGNDYEYSKKIADIIHLKLSPIELGPAEYSINEIKRIVSLNEELISDFTFQISEKLALSSKNRGFKVMLSGMGADELFGGYPRYKLVKYKFIYSLVGMITYILNPILMKIPTINKKLDRFHSFLLEPDFVYAYSNLVGYFNKNEIKDLVTQKDSIKKYHLKISTFLKKVSTESDFKKAFYLDLYGFLSHNFMVADKASMQASIELRVPLVNKFILVKNYYEQESNLLTFFSLKKQLKKILYNIIPKSIVNRKKTGFNPPLDPIINSFDCDTLQNIFVKGSLSKYLHLKPIMTLVDEHFNNRKNNTYKIWQLLYLNYWLEANEN